MARERKKKKKTATVTADMAEKIVAAALSHPTLGADRLARLLNDEGMDVSRSQVYRTLCGKSLQTRELRTRYLEEKAGLEKPAESREAGVVPEPSPEPLQEQPREAPGPPVSIPGIEYAAPAPAEEKPEITAAVSPADIAVPAGPPRIDKIEKAHPGKEKWLFRGINLLLGLFIILLGIHIGVRLYDAQQEPGVAATPPFASEAAAEAGETDEPNRPLSDYRVILDRNLFGAASHSALDPVREAADLKAIGLAGNEVGLKLIGTAVGKDRRKNYAVLEVARTRSQEICREKDMVANVLIKRILRNNVIIQTASGEKRLSVDDKLAPGTAAPLVQPAAAGVIIQEAPQADAENPEITYEIPRSEIAQALPGIRQKLEVMNPPESIPGGKTDGFTVGRVRAADGLYLIGLRTGDVIKSVDGEAVSNLEDTERVLQRIAQGGDFYILVERQGKLQSLNLSIE